MADYPALGIVQVDARNIARGASDRMQNQLANLQLRGLESQTEAQNALKTYLPGAMSGDQSALQKLAGKAPDMAMKVEAHLAGMSEKKRDLAIREAQVINAALLQVKTPDDWERLKAEAAAFDKRAGTSFQQYVQGPFEPQRIGLIQAVAGETAKYGQPVAGVNAQGQPEYRVFNATGASKPVSGFAPTQKEPAGLEEITHIQEKLKKLNPDSEQAKTLQNRLLKLTSTAPSTEVKIDMKGAGKEAEKLAEYRVKRLEDVDKSAEGARDVLDSIEQFRAGMSGFETGAFGDSRATLAAVAKFAGVDPQALGLGDASSAQAIKSAANKMALRFRNMGGGMPGQLSDKDIQFLKEAVANIGNTPDANQVIMAFMERSARRSLGLQREMQDYLEKNETIKGFKFSGSKDEFTAEDRKALQVALKGKKDAPAAKGGTADDPLGLFTGKGM